MRVKTPLKATLDNKIALQFLQGDFDRSSLKDRYKLTKIASKFMQPKTENVKVEDLTYETFANHN